jgi:hypothetical protein
MNQIGKNLYQQVMTQNAGLIQNAINTAVEQAVAQSGQNVSADMSVAAMRRELDYLDNEIMVGQATDLLNKAMKKGNDLTTSIGLVDKYFKKFANNVSGGTQSNDRPGSSRPQDAKRTTQPQRKQNGPDAWDEVFAG